MSFRYYFFIVCFVAVAGCTPQQRLERLLLRNPNLKAAIQRDSFKLYNTVYIDTTLLADHDNFITEVQVDSFLKVVAIDTCLGTTQQRAQSKARLVHLVQSKKCIERPILFADTILYADKEIEMQLPVTILLMQEGDAFRISLQGVGGKVLSYSKAVQVTGITQADINKYRKQGAWIVGGSLLLALLLALIAWVYFKATRLSI